ncbi:hypothetical protein MAR_026214 [Mya arenaria]|uniref:Uncharacterized protein n=1 Tax=Mya arenaria TaxID=6604 RepID=A0ABY7EUF1_MYAAR|nr:hypothetical protein MAR_026214 [Mya arenaria]
MVLTQKFNDLTRMDGLQKVYEIFTSLTVDPGVKTICRGPTCHYTARLAHDTSLNLTLVRVTLLFSNDERTCYEVSHILALLLFDEQARHGMRDVVYNAVGTLVMGAIITVRSMKEHPGQNLQHLPQTIEHLTEQSFRLSRQKPCEVIDFKEQVYDKFIDAGEAISTHPRVRNILRIQPYYHARLRPSRVKRPLHRPRCWRTDLPAFFQVPVQLSLSTEC